VTDDRRWGVCRSTPTEKLFRQVNERTEVDTREGTVVAEPGDYIIQEEDGNCYPISEEKMHEYYEWLPGADYPYPPEDDTDD
jgi:hypothetical protein